MSKLRITLTIIILCLLGNISLFAEHQNDTRRLGFFSNQISYLKTNLIKDFHQAYKWQEIFATYTYDNTSSGTLNNQNSCNTTLQRTFNAIWHILGEEMYRLP